MSKPSRLNHTPKSLVNLLIDLNGTLHVGDQPTQGSLRALRKLREAQSQGRDRIRISFCSNTSKESTLSLHAKLMSMGFTRDLIPVTDLFTSLDATRRYCQRMDFKRPLLLLSGSAQSTFEQAEEAKGGTGWKPFFPSTSKPPCRLTEEEHQTLRSCDSVVVGLAPEFMTHEWLNEAFRLLIGEYANQGEKDSRRVKLIATHRALYHRPKESSPLSLGPGTFIASLEISSKLDPKETAICGKPSKEFLQECLEGMNKPQPGSDGNQPESSGKCIIIGDDVDQDLGGGALDLGFERILVKTGKYRPKDEERGSGRPPDSVFESFSAWVDHFLDDEVRDLGPDL
ncbi:hypothetical protein IE53DRAFT_411499 [Violaceomyces palustris]|uniref:Uncharacterized protein n=1 Tax=Violaceomyces palustris TaxID=1673888 RepID=A0ACD0NUW5_9BASI|nr:hypothetical protein IE53DRAFT_411499 [Violaceomyces palustris]